MARNIGTPYLPGPRGVADPAVRGFLADLTRQLISLFADISAFSTEVALLDGTASMTQPLILATFTVATRPAATAWEGGVIYVSDGGAGSVFQGSNGTAWVDLG